MYRNNSNAVVHTKFSNDKLPVHFFIRIPMTVAITIDAITIDAIAATDEEIESVHTAIKLIFSDVAGC